MSSTRSYSHSHRGSRQMARRPSKAPSFILVDEGHEEEVTCFTIIGNMGIPLLYLVTAASCLIGIICMSVITKYWAQMEPPQCFLFSRPVAESNFYQFGSKLSTCNWVAYGPIVPLIVCTVCGVLYLMHMRDDKELDLLSYGVVTAMFISTVLMMAVSSTYAQGLRITCNSISLNLFNSRSTNCKERLDQRVIQYNLPVQTSSMIGASMATLWMATVGFILITAFHIALVIRRRIRDGEPY